jgi:hypothetical protein
MILAPMISGTGDFCRPVGAAAGILWSPRPDRASGLSEQLIFESGEALNVSAGNR